MTERETNETEEQRKTAAARPHTHDECAETADEELARLTRGPQPDRGDSVRIRRPGEPDGAVSTGDPWAHRAEHMRCRTCMWYAPKATIIRGQDDVIGRCRRRAPTLNGYPAVFSFDWCGDHKLDENKVPA